MTLYFDISYLLLEVINEDPLTIRLKFSPRGEGNAGDQYYLAPKENRYSIAFYSAVVIPSPSSPISINIHIYIYLLEDALFVGKGNDLFAIR